MYANPRKLRRPEQRVGTLFNAALPPPALAGATLARALRADDEQSLARLIREHHPAMMRLARTYVRSREEAEEVIQDTWLAVLTGIDRFEGRSSFRTWLLRILANRARTRARREARSIPFSALAPDATSLPVVAEPTAHARDPEQAVLDAELGRVIERALASLPERQRTVLRLRDVEGRSADEVSRTLALSPGNQRVLLHRARTRMRALLAPYVGAADRAVA